MSSSIEKFIVPEYMDDLRAAADLRTSRVEELKDCKEVELQVEDQEHAQAFLRHLFWGSRSFKFDPFPDGVYSFVIKNEGLGLILEYLDDLNSSYVIVAKGKVS